MVSQGFPNLNEFLISEDYGCIDTILLGHLEQNTENEWLTADDIELYTSSSNESEELIFNDFQIQSPLSSSYSTESDIPMEQMLSGICQSSFISIGMDWRIVAKKNWTENHMQKCIEEFVHKFNKNDKYIKRWFQGERFIRMTPTEISKLSRTKLWKIDCGYGYSFQNWLCKELDIPLPKVPEKRRKQQLKVKNRPRRRTFSNTYLDITETCSITTECNRTSPRDQIRLHIFCLDLLNHPFYKNMIAWKDSNSMIFRVLDSQAIAKVWQIVKENDTCDYENFARGIRYSRARDYFTKPTEQKKKVYQFTQKAISDYMKRNAGRNPLKTIT